VGVGLTQQVDHSQGVRSLRAGHGELATATNEAREALAIARGTGNPGVTSSALALLAYVLVGIDQHRSRLLLAESLELTDKVGVIAIDEQALVMILVTSATLGERHQVLTLSARALDRGFTAMVRLAICLETIAAVIAPEAPDVAAVLHGHVDQVVPNLMLQHRMHFALRECATAAIEAQLNEGRVTELHEQGASLTTEEAAAYALDAIARAVTGD